MFCPRCNRETDPSQPQLRQENEQSMLIKIKNLSPGDARAQFTKISTMICVNIVVFRCLRTLKVGGRCH